MTRLTFAARLVRALVADVLLAFADRIDTRYADRWNGEEDAT